MKLLALRTIKSYRTAAKKDATSKHALKILSLKKVTVRR